MRTPKINSTFIKKYYKTSTLGRLKDLGYKNQVEINKCPIITEWLDVCFQIGNTGYIQEEMFGFVISKKSKNE
jgi:hypothetical protein